MNTNSSTRKYRVGKQVFMPLMRSTAEEFEKLLKKSAEQPVDYTAMLDAAEKSINSQIIAEMQNAIINAKGVPEIGRVYNSAALTKIFDDLKAALQHKLESQQPDDCRTAFESVVYERKKFHLRRDGDSYKNMATHIKWVRWQEAWLRGAASSTR